MVSIARVSRATVFNVTGERVQISSDGRTLKGRAYAEVDIDDEVLTSALERGDVVVVSQQQVTREPQEKAIEQPAAAQISTEETEAPGAEEETVAEGEATELEQEPVSTEEATEASEEEIKIKKSARAKVAKEN